MCNEIIFKENLKSVLIKEIPILKEDDIIEFKLVKIKYNLFLIINFKFQNINR